jgi:hypothetical protein
MIAELADGDLGQQSRSRQAAIDRLGRRRRRGHVLLARPTSVFPANVLDHFQLGRDVVELLTRLRADSLPHLTAAGARFFLFAQIMLDPLAGQVGRQLAASAAAANMRRDRRLDDRSRGFGRLFAARLEQRQLIGIELLASRAKAGSHELSDVML